eukprot:scaffold7526_cov30-Tisochrysis_lutea.AAC.1
MSQSAPSGGVTLRSAKQLACTTAKHLIRSDTMLGTEASPRRISDNTHHQLAIRHACVSPFSRKIMSKGGVLSPAGWSQIRAPKIDQRELQVSVARTARRMEDTARACGSGSSCHSAWRGREGGKERGAERERVEIVHRKQWRARRRSPKISDAHRVQRRTARPRVVKVEPAEKRGHRALVASQAGTTVALENTKET